MTDPDILLAALWAADEPPARDPVFVAAVMAAQAKRRFQRSLLALVPTTVAGAAVLWSAAPFVARLFASFDLNVVGSIVAALALAVLVMGGAGLDVEPERRAR